MDKAAVRQYQAVVRDEAQRLFPEVREDEVREDEVRARTGFDLPLDPEGVSGANPPSEEQLRLIDALDPQGHRQLDFA